ncbi:MAG: ABC transporter ATP-binding protein [Anaerolineae bacterium]|nr:ABC transporter ATP-binding protein [Anaerolineae bacterium]
MAHTVRFQDVTKRFSVRHEGPLSFQAILMNALRLRRRLQRQQLWVLRDVSFEVGRGEMLGIVGVNGSGKSTTLKLISRIIEPTTGTVEVTGRVSALLELGAGFHPDLTGRENVYLNGSIMGMRRRDIDACFDDIVAFAGIPAAIDVPVRYYSSGMYMRLGFSVAIHSDPEVLLVDEVLAVGDHAFQVRCLDKAAELRRRGVTVLFVSHDMDAVRELCDRAIWLDGGGVRAEGDPEDVVTQYLRGFGEAELELLARGATLKRGQRWGTGDVQLVDVQFVDAQGCPRDVFLTGETVCVRMRYRTKRRIVDPVFGVALYTSTGAQINSTDMRTSRYTLEAIEGEGVVEYHLPSLPLLRGNYLVSAFVYNHAGEVPVAYDHLEKAYLLRMVNADGIDDWTGSVYLPSRWTCSPDGIRSSRSEV